jgi:hypothetical protein
LSFLATALASGNSTSTLADVEPGVLGFLVLAGMGLALFFLLKSMSKQFKKLGPPPEEKGADVSAEARNQAETQQPEDATKGK